MKFNICLLFICMSFITQGQEICDNAIDDDDDGLIDLNDDDCICEMSADTTIDYIPNPSFEDNSGCPVMGYSPHLIDLWSWNNSPEYFHECGLISVSGAPILPGEVDKDGLGYIGSYAPGAPIAADANEYLKICLNTPFLAGVTYKLDFVAALEVIYPDKNYEYAIFGKDNCLDLSPLSPGTTWICSEPGWTELGSTEDLDYPGTMIWTPGSILFTPAVDMYAFAFGPACDDSVIWDYQYAYIDDFTITELLTPVVITATGGWCAGDFILEATIDTVGGTWQWYKEGIALIGETSPTLSPLIFGEGTYNAVYTVSGTCFRNDYLVEILDELTVDLGADTSLCFLTDFTLNAENSGAIYEWQDGSLEQTFNVLDTGIYHVNVTSLLSGCSANDTIVISALALNVDLGADTTICYPTTISLDAGTIPGAIYNWSDSSTSPIIMTDMAASYWVNVSAGICAATDTIDINVENLTAQFTLKDSTFCEQQVLTFTDTSLPDSLVNSWLWNFGDGTIATEQNPVHTYFVTGTYNISLIVTSLNGCNSDSSRTLTVNIIESPTAAFTMNPTIVSPDDIVVFTNNSENETIWDWDFGDGTNSIEFEPTHVYTGNNNYDVTLTVSNGFCTDQITQTVIVKEELLYFVPNSFTPDGDPLNQIFLPVFTEGFDIYNYHLTIYNRWGELIFESFDASIGWNGEFGNNGLVEDGIYIWKINFKEASTDKRYIETGHVSVLK